MIHMSGTDFYYEPQIRLAEKLINCAPFYNNKYDPLSIDAKVFFCNSGAEANEAAMKLTRLNAVAPTYIAFYGAFHGRTLGALSLTASKIIQKQGFEPLMNVSHVPYADCENCIFRMKKETCVQTGTYECLKFLTDYVLAKKVDPYDVAAIFVEPIQGEGGYIVPPDGWLKKLEYIAEYNGINLVIDEIQSGMGRTGKMWACEHFSVEPTMITAAKGIASGMPLGVLIAKDMNWTPGQHASTFGGNPISCAASLATFEVIEEEDLLTNATDRGDQLDCLLSSFMQRYDFISNARGLGLMRAIDIATPELRSKILRRSFEKGLLLLPCGASGIRFCPPLTISRKEINKGMEIFEEVLKSI
jgi:4-aminobutyrate aminotransferase